MRSLEGSNWPDEHVGVRRQLIGLIRARRRKHGAPPLRPVRIRYFEVVDPESGKPLTNWQMWQVIERFLDEGVALEPVTLHQPPGERGWTCKFRLASAEPLVYVKFQIIGSHVVLRSFHYSEHDRRA